MLNIPIIFVALKKRGTPATAKILAGIIVGYALSPIDIIPDFIPIFGLLDDLIVLPLLISLVIKMIPDEILSECRIEAEGLWSHGRPTKWFYSLPIFLLWGFMIFLVVNE